MTRTPSSAAVAATCSWRRGTGRRWSGVWHKVYQGHPDAYEVSEAELEAWTGEINLAYGGLDLTPTMSASPCAGLIPFGENDPDAAHLKFAHRSRLVDHAAERGLAGLLTLIGVRYTTGPVEAAEAVDAGL